MLNLSTQILAILLAIPGSILAFSMRGISQAFVADKLGDPTPKLSGRLTLNPFAHIDIFGFIFIVLFGFGWTKPIPVNTRNFNNPKRDNAILLLSGPIGCMLAGFVCSFLCALMSVFANLLPDALWVFQTLAQIFNIALMRCVLLGAFYLLPLPGLDGFNLIINFMPYKYYGKLYNIQRYSMFIFMGFILLINFTFLGSIIFWPAYKLCDLMKSVWFFMY